MVFCHYNSVVVVHAEQLLLNQFVYMTLFSGMYGHGEMHGRSC